MKPIHLLLTGQEQPEVGAPVVVLNVSALRADEELIGRMTRLTDVTQSAARGDWLPSLGEPLTDRPHSAARCVTAMLTELGVPVKLLGFGYLRSAVLLLLTEQGGALRLSRGVYPAVARQFAATPASVERAIRHAITLTWARGGQEQYRRVLGRMGSVAGDRPTNGEFISQVAEGARLRLLKQ